MPTIFAALVVTRWLHFAAVFVLFGSTFFWIYAGAGFPRARRATENLLRAAAPVAAISGLIWLGEIIANMSGAWRDVFDRQTLRLFFFETQFGPVALIRLLLLAAAVLIAFWPARNRIWLFANLAIGGLLLIDQAWLGHAAEGGADLSGAAMIAAYCIHVLASAAWVGGLPPLLFALIELRGFDAAECARRTFALLERFSAMAMVTVVLILASGIVNVGFRIGFSPRLSGWGDYGAILAAKSALVAAMLVIACFNRLIAMPRLCAATADGAAPAARLRASVALELALGVLVVGAAAALGITPPPQ